MSDWGRRETKVVSEVMFMDALEAAAAFCYMNSYAHGFWPEGVQRNKGEQIALMHSELSELLEGVRKPSQDSHCPEFTSEEIEAADVLIRLLDYCAGHGLDLGQATIAKMKFNRSRPHKHGKGF